VSQQKTQLIFLLKIWNNPPVPEKGRITTEYFFPCWNIEWTRRSESSYGFPPWTGEFNKNGAAGTHKNRSMSLFFLLSRFLPVPGPCGAKAAIQCRCTWTNLSMFQVGQWGQVMKVAQVHQEAGHWNISAFQKSEEKKRYITQCAVSPFPSWNALQFIPFFDNGRAQGGPTSAILRTLDPIFRENLERFVSTPSGSTNGLFSSSLYLNFFMTGPSIRFDY